MMSIPARMRKLIFADNSSTSAAGGLPAIHHMSFLFVRTRIATRGNRYADQ